MGGCGRVGVLSACSVISEGITKRKCDVSVEELMKKTNTMNRNITFE